MNRYRRVGMAMLLLVVTFIPLAHAAAGEALKATLANGLRVVIVPSTLAPVVTTQISYLAGTDQDPPGLPGVAMSLAQLTSRSMHGLSKEQFSTLVRSMGGRYEADAQRSLTRYRFTVPKQDLSVVLHIEAQRMRGLDIQQSTWDSVREMLKRRLLDSAADEMPTTNAHVQSVLFKGTPYARRTFRSSLDRLSVADLKTFYDTWYVPRNAVLLIAGDVDPPAVLAQVKTLFGAIPGKALPARPHAVFHFQPVQGKLTISPSPLRGMGIIFISWRLPGYQSEDQAAVSILADVLNSQRSLFYHLKNQGITDSSRVSLQMWPEASLMQAAMLYPQSQAVQALLDRFRTDWGKLLKQGIPTPWIEAAKRQEIAKLAWQKNSLESLAQAWSDALTVQGLESPEQRKAQFAAVTADQVNRVARQFLSLDKTLVQVVLPQGPNAHTQHNQAAADHQAKPLGKRPLVKSISSGSKTPGRTQTLAKQNKPADLPVWAKTALAQPLLPAWPIHLYDTVLPNGLRLIVLPESQSDTVGVYGYIQNQLALQVQPGQQAAVGLLQALYAHGTTSLDRTAFVAATEAIGARVRVGIAPFSVEAPAAHFERAVQLLADNELHPALSAAALTIEQRRLAQLVRQGADPDINPEAVFEQILYQSLLPVGDPTLRPLWGPWLKTDLSLAQVKTYWQRNMRPDLTTLVVIGKITPQQAKQTIATYFGAWRGQGPKPSLRLPPVPANLPISFHITDPQQTQDQVTLAQNIGVTLTNPDHATLALGGQLLTDALARSLHALGPQVEFIHAGFDFGDSRSEFRISYNSAPDQTAQVHALVMHELKRLQHEPVSQAALAHAQNTLLRQFILGQTSSKATADKLLYLARHHLPLNQPLLDAQRYLQLTPVQIQTAFKRYLRPDAMVEGVLGPMPH